MHAKFCVKRPNGVGVVFLERQTHTQTDRQTDRPNENPCPLSALGPSNCSKLQCGNNCSSIMISFGVSKTT